MVKPIIHNRENVEKLVELLDDMGVVEDKEGLVEELMIDNEEFDALYNENYEPAYWGHWDEEDMLSDEELSEQDDVPGLRW